MTSAAGSRTNITLRLALLAGALVAGFMTSVCIGDVCIEPVKALTVLTGGFAAGGTNAGVSTPGLSDILTQIRLPRTLIATTVGAALAVSGYILQALSRNPLADPYLTGVSSGAGLAVAIAIMIGVDFNFMPASAFAGGLLAALLVAQMARRAEDFR